VRRAWAWLWALLLRWISGPASPERPERPHDPTADQLYKDQRFEAYRALGARAAQNAVAASRA
jgi:hypothetical protein